MDNVPILTPKPSPKPRINSPKIFGVRPGSPFLFTIAATGERPMAFFAEGLPSGIQLDPRNGRITGVLDNKGEYRVKLKAENALGSCEKDFKIVVGDKIALTPPMGWNSWNCWNKHIDAQKVKENAEAMVKLGLINYGWTYMNIDDTWQGERSTAGEIMPNEKFPDMKGLCDYVHNLGLKMGIYSTPWVKTFAAHIGSTSGEPIGDVRDEKNGWFVGKEFHEEADAKQWAKWGVDYLKYDWNPTDFASGVRMREALLKCGRDIVYSVCSSAPMSEAAAWAEICEAFFLWRRKGDNDIKDSWKSVSSIGFRMNDWAKYASPGHWDDPDMLVVGMVGWGNKLRPCLLTPDEQYTHISLWCLLSAPLLLGNDLTQMDEFTLSLLTNSEVIDINQGTLGKPASLLVRDGDTDIWFKCLEDGSKAVGLFNLSDECPRKITLYFPDLKLEGRYTVRDLWKQQDLGTFDTKFEAEVNSHGVVFIKIIPED